MKKLLVSLLFVGLAAVVSLLVMFDKANGMTLYDCYQTTGRGWPSVLERASDAASVGIWQYRGLASQNKELSSKLCPVGSDGEALLGFSVATGYEKNLRLTMNATQTFIPVTSFLLKDGTTLAMSSLGSQVFLTIEPGTSREEIALCTGMSTSTTNFDPCIRGLAFSGTSTASVSANRKTHGAGSKVVMSNVHYVYDQLTDKDSTEDIGGVKRFTSSSIKIGNGTTSTNKSVFADNGTASLPFVRYNETTGRWQFSDNGTDTVNLATSSAAGLSASTTKGIFITDSLVGVNASSTTGMDFGLDGRLYQKVSSTRLTASDSNGLYVVTNTAWSLGSTLNVSGTTTMATTTMTSSTVTQLNLPGKNVNNLLTNLLFSTTTAGSINFSTASTTLVTTTVPAGTLDTGNVIQIALHVTRFGLVVNTPCYWNLRYGSQTFDVQYDNNNNAFNTNIDGGAAYPISSTSGWMYINLMTNGTTSTASADFFHEFSSSTLAGTTSPFQPKLEKTTALKTINQTIDQSLVLTARMNNSSAAETLVVEKAWVRVLR